MFSPSNLCSECFIPKQVPGGEGGGEREPFHLRNCLYPALTANAPTLALGKRFLKQFAFLLPRPAVQMPTDTPCWQLLPARASGRSASPWRAVLAAVQVRGLSH